MKVLDGTQSDSTHAPPAPSSSMTVTSASSCAATSAASYPAGPPPMITTRPMLGPPRLITDRRILPHGPGDYRHRRAPLRRVRLKSRPRSHAGGLPALATGRHRLARGLAADLRRGGSAGVRGRRLHRGRR